MMYHYETQATARQKKAGYASVASRWNKVSADSTREFLAFNYYEGDNENTPILPPEAIIHRDKFLPKVRICHS
jgi:hypothetical protein